MTHHSEMTGSSENGDIAGRDPKRPAERIPQDIACTAFESHGGEQQVTLRSPAELADALPYLLGYRPEDSVVLVALHDKDGRGRFGGRARLGIPANPDDWPAAARQLAHGLVTGSERRGARPEQVVVFLCQDPGDGQTGRQVKEMLGPLAHALRLECGSLEVPVVEALCVSDGRFWSYCCDDGGCCPAEGTPMGLPGTSVLAAAATYAGLQVRGTLRELRARFLPWEGAAALEQEVALDTAGLALVPRILDASGRDEVAEETLELAERIMGRLADAPPVSGMRPADLRDDDLLGHDEAAALILGLQDRTTRDRAAEWMEGEGAGPALRLWRALARRCVGPYAEHAAAPLTLAGWVAWSTGDELEGREALAMALAADPDYLFARLLHQACNEGLDPESVRRCLRAERGSRGSTEARTAQEGADTGPRADGEADAADGSAVGDGRSAGGGTAPDGGPEADLAQRTGAECAAGAGSVGDAGQGGCVPAESAPAVPAGAASVPEVIPPRRRRRTRAPGARAGSGTARAGRAEDRRPGVRIPRPRTTEQGRQPRAGKPGGTHPGAGRAGGVRPGAGRAKGAHPDGAVGPEDLRRRGVRQEGAQPGGRGDGGEE
ncbi:DUF4192 family protein [Streptomyces sp. NPDC005931]|uniref:DUF4192 domain-containing protein n=1 Tax=Streptomyces sp. NPDC005931 TaxID=3364737 RepID=UPI0036C08CCF